MCEKDKQETEMISIPRKVSRRFAKIIIPRINAETGEREYEEYPMYKSRIVIPVSECQGWTQLSPKTIKRMMRKSDLTPLEANGKERKHRKVGNNPLFFDLKEFSEMDL